MNEESSLALECLATIELFRDLSSDELCEVMALVRVRRFDKDALIFNQGDAAGRAHVLVEGSVRITQSGSNGAQVVMRFIAPGETFGTVALFTDRQYPAEAFAITGTIEASWSEDDLRDLMGRYPQIAMNVIHIIGKRLQEAQERVRELATQRAEQRVATSCSDWRTRPVNLCLRGRRSHFPCGARMLRTSPESPYIPLAAF